MCIRIQTRPIKANLSQMSRMVREYFSIKIAILMRDKWRTVIDMVKGHILTGEYINLLFWHFCLKKKQRRQILRGMEVWQKARVWYSTICKWDHLWRPICSGANERIWQNDLWVCIYFVFCCNIKLKKWRHL